MEQLSIPLRLLLCLILSAFAVRAPAQVPPVPPGGRGGAPTIPPTPGGMLGNLTALRERQMARLQEQLEATEDEWKILRPRLEKLMVLKVDASGGVGSIMLFMRIPPGFAAILRATGWIEALGPFGALLDSPVTSAAEELRGTLSDQESRAADISFRLQTYRRARDEARAEFDAAQDALRELLTPRQEAFLASQALLD